MLKKKLHQDYRVLDKKYHKEEKEYLKYCDEYEKNKEVNKKYIISGRKLLKLYNKIFKKWLILKSKRSKTIRQMKRIKK